MNSRYWLAWGAVVLAGAVGVAADPPRSTPESVRATIKMLWSNKPDKVGEAYKQLEADPLARPVLQVAATTDPDVSHRGVLERLVEKGTKARDKQLVKHIEQWAADGRLDLLTEVRTLTDGEGADGATDHLLKAAAKIREKSEEVLTARCPTPPRFPVGGQPWVDRAGLKASKTTPVFDRQVTLLEKWEHKGVALFGDRIDSPGAEMRDSLVVCRSELKHYGVIIQNRVGRCSAWDNSLMFANCSIWFERAIGCLLVVDGDLELAPMGRIDHSVVVVNGNIGEYGARPGCGFGVNVVWAVGDINVTPNVNPYTRCVFIAGGKVANPDKLAAEGCVTQNAKEPPLPVRFLDPAADYGLTLEANKEGMTVAKIAEKSAFAEHLKTGDVIAAVTGVKTPTAPAFRRELRRGIIEGAVLLEVVRGKEKVELLVPMPDVPPAPKKDKKDDPKAKPVEK